MNVSLDSIQDNVNTNLIWNPSTLLKLKNISDVQISPDHTSFLCVVTSSELDQGKNEFTSQIYKGYLSEDKDLTIFIKGKYSYSQPRWSPNGQWIAFLSKEEGIKCLNLISSHGGRIDLLIKTKNDVQTFRWSPDSKMIAFVMSDQIESNQHGYFFHLKPKKINRLWTIDTLNPNASLKSWTGNQFFVRGQGDFGTINEEFDWSPNGDQIIFSYSQNDGLEGYHLDSSLASLDFNSGKIIEWEKRVAFESMPRYSPDGTLVAYVGSESIAKFTYERHLNIRSFNGEYIRQLKPTKNEGPLLMGPHFLGWTDDGLNLLYFEPHQTKFSISLVPIDENSNVKILQTDEYFFKEPILSPNRTMLGLVLESPTQPQEVAITKIWPFKPQLKSQFNSEYLHHPIPKTETIFWHSTDKLRIEGLLTYPINYKPNQKYPLLVVIHGGPMMFFNESFIGSPFYPLLSFAESGFFILRPNIRGSTGYGKAFRSSNIGDWGGKDFEDIITGVNGLISKELIDSEKMGIMGWSYGGFLAARTITKTLMFKAASFGAGPYNLLSDVGTTDLPKIITDYLGSYCENQYLYLELSPIYYVNQINTPCLLQHGIDDKRVPISQSYEFYYALRCAGKNAALYIHQETGHNFDKPKMQLESFEINLDWFKKTLS